MDKTLAIIIPAYKSRFLHQALDSAARQTCGDFKVYVGDDNSSEDLFSIVDSYSDRLDIVYCKFEENLGRNDLSAHWERCIKMASEPYIYLFSDDDIMPCDIVERFLKALEENPGHGFFRIQLAVIDQNNSIIHCNPPLHDGRTDERTMLCDKLSGKISSATCEFIFSSALFHSTGQFVHFPHAWCSDDATWFRLAMNAGGVVNIPGYPALWRNVPDVNISNDRKFDRDKEKATAGFISWLRDNYPDPKDRKFISCLYKYVKCILSISLDGRCSKDGLKSICIALGKFSWIYAMMTRIRFLGKTLTLKLEMKK